MGIIANPASGKDIRRLVAHATTVDNRGKISIIRRALVGLGAMGVERVAIMPDSHALGERALKGLDRRATIPSVTMLDMAMVHGAKDSQRAAEQLCQNGARCILILGGDGTIRVVSKGAGQIPLLPILTGTNNVLPAFVEGTVAGMAAGGLATGKVSIEEVARRHKWLDVSVNGESTDRALVDVAIVKGRFVGSRAIWQASDIERVVATRADPASIGMSAIIGALRPTRPEDAHAVSLVLGPGGQRVLAAVGPGLIAQVGIASSRTLQPGDAEEFEAKEPIIVALDGEREFTVHPGDRVAIALRSDGPWVVDVPKAMHQMATRGVFRAQSASLATQKLTASE